MSVVVPDGMSIDQALKFLWRESNRENVPFEIRKRMFRIKKNEERHTQKKEYAKRKRRRRKQIRNLKRKGQHRKLMSLQ